MPPGDEDKLYNTLYKDFIVAYINAHVLRREFYPQAKKLVEQIEPELSAYLDRTSQDQSEEQHLLAHLQLNSYVGSFDNFTLMANRLFSDLQLELEKSDSYMNKMLELKIDLNKSDSPTSVLFPELIPELNRLVTGLTQIGDRAKQLEIKMRKLETDWTETKAKLS